MIKCRTSMGTWTQACYDLGPSRTWLQIDVRLSLTLGPDDCSEQHDHHPQQDRDVQEVDGGEADQSVPDCDAEEKVSSARAPKIGFSKNRFSVICREPVMQFRAYLISLLFAQWHVPVKFPTLDMTDYMDVPQALQTGPPPPQKRTVGSQPTTLRSQNKG